MPSAEGRAGAPVARAALTDDFAARLRACDDETLHLVAAIVRMGARGGPGADATAAAVRAEVERRFAPHWRSAVFLASGRHMR